jgi:hypothetical protein
MFIEDKRSRNIRKPALSEAPDNRRRNNRSGFAGTGHQSFREAAWQPGWGPLDPRQQAMATGLPVGWRTTKPKPVTFGEILIEEFIRPMGLIQAALAEAMGVPAQACQRAVQ